MRHWLVRGILAVVFLLGAMIGAFALMGTTERAIPAQTPGYTTADITVDHRDVPVTLHIWYPPARQTKPGLLAQNHLFYGHYAQLHAAPQDGPLPMIVVSHGSGGNSPQMGWLLAPLALAGFVVVAPIHPGTTSRDSDPFQTIKIWERPLDLTAAIDFMLADAPVDLNIDPARIGAMGFSLGGHSALALSGLQVSKDKFIAYCDRFPDTLDCGWMTRAGVDFTTIDAPLYEASYKDPRISATLAIEPALPLAVQDASLAALDHPVQLINLGRPENIPNDLRVDTLAAAVPDGRFHAVLDSWHFSFLAECSPAGKIVLAIASPENICADVARPRAELHDELRGVIVPFFSDTLGGG